MAIVDGNGTTPSQGATGTEEDGGFGSYRNTVAEQEQQQQRAGRVANNSSSQQPRNVPRRANGPATANGPSRNATSRPAQPPQQEEERKLWKDYSSAATK